ncbi:hypothetical protein GCM10023220_02850 [Streptomyces ziwulingensis]|uniref:Uncharacterized protein n=1 Tax=Streptomyces ziwulingensis TaxID=1045501 RepID=A0ABP9AM09_9ACTN
MSVLVDEGLEVGQRLFQRPFGDVRQDDGGHGSFVLWRQRHVGAGHGNGSWHARLPVSPWPSVRRRSLRHTWMTSLRDYLSTVTTRL